MSRHQAYRNYDYENELDDFDGGGYADEGGEEELSPEDKAQMAAATDELKAVLGPKADKVTAQQIRESLWYYYFDVDKTAAYLISKFIDPAPPKQPAKAAKKTPEHYDARPWPARSPAVVSYLDGDSPCSCAAPSRPLPPRSFADFFHDMPWRSIPRDREAVFLAPPRPGGGLLGGSGAPPKMSKLQALAAARKKKGEGKKPGDHPRAPAREAPLDSPKGRIGPSAENRKSLVLGLSKRRKLEDGSSSSDAKPDATGPAMSGDAASDVPQELPRPPEVAMEDAPPPPPEPAKPSAFAQTLLGSASAAPTARPQFFSPYMAVNDALSAAFAKPSPDDVVLSAQSQAGKKPTPAAPKKKAAGGDVASDIQALKVDAPLPKSKNLDVLSEFEKAKSKKSASFVVVGHVDAGKSTLMGRLLLDLNVVDQRTVEKYRREAESIGKASFALAWILDQRTEERSRGVTIDIATNKFETDTTSFTILDAPGHRDFIPNMIAGASQADFAVLVVDASTGAFEAGLKGQTKEHSLLIRSMGVSRVIVAVNKLDVVKWDKQRFDEICQQVSGFLSATGFQPKNISFVPVSGLRGDNLARRSAEAAASWYEGPTLIEELENSEPLARALTKPLRMTISEVYKTQLSALTISGRIDAGSLQTGDAILVQPSGEKAYVKSLEVDGQAADWAVAGQNAAMHLTNVDPVHVRVGDIICDPAKPIQCLDTFTVKVLAFDVLMPMQVDVHRGRLHSAGRISELSALLDKTTGAVAKRRPKIVKPASVARVVVRMDAKVPLEAGQRVVLRSAGETVAAGLLE